MARSSGGQRGLVLPGSMRTKVAVPMAVLKPTSRRLAALDWLRGLVMVLMTVDHASGTFNAGRLMTDGLALYQPGTPLPASQFLTRWITHLCAPTFVFLAGSALALSVEKRRAAGESPRAIDRFILARGLLIMALDPLWMSPRCAASAAAGSPASGSRSSSAARRSPASPSPPPAASRPCRSRSCSPADGSGPCSSPIRSCRGSPS